jgi:hypothetical protein
MELPRSASRSSNLKLLEALLGSSILKLGTYLENSEKLHFEAEASK